MTQLQRKWETERQLERERDKLRTTAITIRIYVSKNLTLKKHCQPERESVREREVEVKRRG